MQNKTKHYQVQEGLLEAESFVMCLFDLHSIITSLANNLRIQFLLTSCYYTIDINTGHTKYLCCVGKK